MDPDNRDWGRGSPVDYVPFLGVVYRFYWCFVAKRGARRERLGSAEPRHDWRKAFRSEVSRLFVAAVASTAVVVFFVLGGTEGGLEPALLIVVAGLFVHRLVSLAAIADA